MQKQEIYLQEAGRQKQFHRRLWHVILCLSLVAILCVFWGLKMTGITLAGEAFCGVDEHIHGEECRTKVCQSEETEEHTHTEACYELTCSLEEHIHIESCYSDITADLETEDDWEMSLADLERGTTTAENVVLVAGSQLGVAESERNFEVDAAGVRRGITRYGQWYGNPYGDWSAMFASFCLTYAGAEDAPANAGPESMRLEWEKADLYRAAADYTPKVGNLLFLNQQASETDTGPPADSVAIITEVTKTQITTIQGDVDGVVAQVPYAIDDARIVGYGLVPETSDYVALAEPPPGAEAIAKQQNFTTALMTGSDSLVFYTEYNGVTYAIDGTGRAVEVYVDDNGRIYTDLENPALLLWTSARYNNNSYAIQNVGSGRYLHPFYNSSSDNGITTPGRWGTSTRATGTGVRFEHSAYIRLDAAAGQFSMTRTSGENVTFQVGVCQTCTVWFDGTCGGIMSLGGSDDTCYTVTAGSRMTLPSQWKSPEKYDYTLKGWYDITHNKYYKPGETVVMEENTVFYADWMAASYDVGQFNSHVDEETISTNSFVTTRLFDYSVLFNLYSERVDSTVNATGHSETWRLITSGNNPYNGDPTLNFILRDWDRGGEDISYPNGHNAINNPTEAGTVYPGLYTDVIKELLFNPETEVLGKTYVGEGDYLFQLCEDPNHDHYGYYYYNSERNAASYNQSDQRFYVYDYLECTRDSLNGSDNGKYSDFLPLNSPYANGNDKRVNTYTYDGVEGEYTGTTHYMYDSKYNTDNNSANYVGTNYWFGMSVDVEFYLPNAPGTQAAGGGYGNQDVYGKDMHFHFSGDDDVWVFVDGKMVLDLGGLHGRESGDINFSTGLVTVNGVVDEAKSRTLQSIKAGEHTLTLYYMERGSSLSNCAIYFNLAPRFDFSIEKEDVLTKEVLNGAQFSVYTDAACTIPAELWPSKESHDNGDPSTNVFTVTKGVAHMWGMGAGNTYYIRESKPPDNPDYGFPSGIIRLTFDKGGNASYNVEIVDGGDGVSPGFLVHGFRIDPETQQAYIVATNAPSWVKETTTVQVLKHWEDGLSHDGQAVTVYLTVTDPDGTVRRLQEMELSAANNWTGRWDNLPKYERDGATLVRYGVEESYVSGYYSTVEPQTGQFEIVHTTWQNATTFADGKEYILKNPSGQALSTQQSAEDTGYKWVSVEEAKTSPLALWTASVRNNTVRLTNRAGQTITYYYGNGSPTDFFAWNRKQEDNNYKQYLTMTQSGGAVLLGYNRYYLANSMLSNNKYDDTTQQSQALRLTPYTQVPSTATVPIEGQGFLVTNTPLEKETSLTVHKQWSIPPDMDASVYEKEQITVKLFANGTDTGRTVTLTLKNGWTDVFRGLPYEDGNGTPIVYTVKEARTTDTWIVSYGDVVPSGGSPPNYTTTVTNTYRVGGPLLPTTGSPARILYTVCGMTLMLIPLVVGFGLRRKRERRRE